MPIDIYVQHICVEKEHEEHVIFHLHNLHFITKTLQELHFSHP